MKRSDWFMVLFILAVIAGVIYGIPRLTGPSQHKWDTIIERCHDADGRDYDGCMRRENLEWNRGGKSGTL